MVDAMSRYVINALAEYNSECVRQAVNQCGIPSVIRCLLGQPGLLNKILFGYTTLLAAVFYDAGGSIIWAINDVGYRLNELKEYYSVDSTAGSASQQSPLSSPDISFFWTVVFGLLAPFERSPFSSFFMLFMGLMVLTSGGQRLRQAWYRRYPQSARETSFEGFKSMIMARYGEGSEARFKWMREWFTTAMYNPYMKTIYIQIPKTPDELQAALGYVKSHIQPLFK